MRWYANSIKLINDKYVSRKRYRRKGAIAALAAILMVVMLGVMAFAIDLGYIFSMQTELQRACDAAALAGVKELPNGEGDAQAKAVEYLVRNPVGNAFSFTTNDDINYKVSEFLSKYSSELTFSVGTWDPEQKKLLTSGLVAPSSLSVSRTYTNIPLFFAPVLGTDTFSITAESVATFQPRDIMLVLDFSASMNDDSSFDAYATLGKSEVDANLLQCYQDLGSPSYGSLAFEPRFAKIAGTPPTAVDKPQIIVEYKNTAIAVTSTLPLENVVVKFSNNAIKTFSGLSGLSGSFTGSGSTANKTITQVWVKSGNNLSGQGPNYGESFNFSSSTINAKIKSAFGLTNTNYPYSAGNWDDYINYCKSSSNVNKTAGYQYQFGYKNLITYWLENYPAYHQVPDLWKVSAQPVTALKDSVDLFVAFLKEVPTNDNLGLSIYNSTNGNGVLEKQLNSNFDQIAGTVRQRQAGHYSSYTNIGAGMQTARLHLDSFGRKNAKKMLVVMTDGNANWNNGAYNVPAAEQMVIDEANLCAATSRRYPVITISLGAGADTSIMQQVADITNGTHFNVPGGASISVLKEQLREAFKKIASQRPLQLVK
jgi:Flp pilus assembly protein TadG